MNLAKILNKIGSRARHYYKNLVMDEHSKAFIEFNRKTWGSWSNKKPQGVVLVYYSDISLVLVADSYFTNILARKHNAKIMAFSSTRKIFPLSLFYWKRDAIFRSFNTQGFIRTRLNDIQEARKNIIVEKVVKQIKTKQDVYDLKVDGIWIGIDIYETYLRIHNRPTVDIGSLKLKETIEQAVAILVFWQDYLKTQNVKSIVVTHDVYIYENILCKLCYQNNIPVYLPNVIGGSKVHEPFASYDPLYRNYRSMFQQLPLDVQEQALAHAENQMQRRFSGEVAVDMEYSKDSAFKPPVEEVQVLRPSDKLKVVICSHCFYDNPHGYRILFVDFYEWLTYLNELSKKTDYDWYLKTHPNPLPGTLETIREILGDSSKITVLPSDTSHLQLVKEGLDVVLTVYGTVGHELAALGVQVVNAGYNPHIAYDFNWQPKSLAEYEEHLLNLPALQKQVDKKEIYEFYYMHYYYTKADDLFFNSYKQFITEVPAEQQSSPIVYGYFLKQLSEERHQKICSNLLDFIESEKPYYLSRGPEGAQANIEGERVHAERY